jgi:hypothetical protein
MISDGCSDANGGVLIKRVGQHLLPPPQAWGLWWPGPSVAAPRTGNRHIDLVWPPRSRLSLGHGAPGSVVWMRMSGRTARAHGDAGTLELLADRAQVNAQFGTDLTQGPALAVQVGRTLNVHGRHRNESQPDPLSTNRMLCQISKNIASAGSRRRARQLLGSHGTCRTSP